MKITTVLKVITAILALIPTVLIAVPITLIVILAILDMANHPVQERAKFVSTIIALIVWMTLLSAVFAKTGTDKIPTIVEAANPAMMYTVLNV